MFPAISRAVMNSLSNLISRSKSSRLKIRHRRLLGFDFKRLERLEERLCPSAITVQVARIFTVDSLDGGLSGNTETQSGDLRWCVQQANTTPGKNTIQFQNGLMGTIIIAPELEISQDVTIQGIYTYDIHPQVAITIQHDSTEPDARVFQIDQGVNCTLIGLGISGGRATGANDSDGGGILNNGVLSIQDCSIYGNYASMSGGGISSEGETASVAISQTDIYTNISDVWGGGIYLGGVSATLISDNIVGNASSVTGGGIQIDGSDVLDVFIYGTEITYNSAENGGGISNGANLTLTNSIISDNRATTGNGGGIWQATGDLQATSVAIDLNFAAMNGGGFYVSGGTSSLDAGSSFYSNTVTGMGTAIYRSDATVTLNNLAVLGPLQNLVTGN